MEQIIFILIIAVIAFLNWLFRESGLFGAKPEDPDAPGDPREREQARPRPQQRQEEGQEQDEIRKFLEALGLPEESPPPVPQSSQEAPPLPQEQREPSRSQARPEAPPYQRTDKQAYQRPPRPASPHHRPRTEPAQLSRAEAAAFEKLEQGEELPITDTAPDPYKRRGDAYSLVRDQIGDVDVRELLDSTEGLRKAVLLREILGRPVGLQSGYEPAHFSKLD